MTLTPIGTPASEPNRPVAWTAANIIADPAAPASPRPRDAQLCSLFVLLLIGRSAAWTSETNPSRTASTAWSAQCWWR